MKKFICLILILVLLGTSGAFFYHEYIIQPDESYEDIWKTNRKLPESLALDAYLSGNVAKKQHHIEQAIESYEKVLRKDPENTALLKDFYVLAMFQGTPKIVLPYLDKVPDSFQKVLMTDYLKAAQLFKENPNQLTSFLQNKKKQKSDDVILPLFNCWYAVKENDKVGAINALKSLQNNNQLGYLLGYHEFLLGSYFNDEELKSEGLKKIQERKLPSIGFFPLLKEYAQKDKSWNTTLLYQQSQKMEQLYPATFELIQTYGQYKITPEIGLAESFYFLSTESIGLFSKEEAVFLNSIALYLQPDKTLALIWGAELAQSFEFPYMSISYYKKITPKSATILFKEAAVLLLDDKTEEADKIMQELYKTNMNHIPLLTLMGQNYLNMKQVQKALDIYDRLIPLLEQNPQNKPLAEAYNVRAHLYQMNHQDEKMIADLERAQILTPDDPMLKNDIGYYYLDAGQIDKGFDLIQAAYNERPQDPYILDSLAYAYYKKDQSQTALLFAERALNALPQSALINMHLGDIYQATGRLREARFQYKKALDLKEDLTPELEEQIKQRIERMALEH